MTAYQAYEKAISYIGDRIGGVIVCIGLREYFPPAHAIKANKSSAPKDTATIGADPSFFSFRLVGWLLRLSMHSAAC